MERLGEELQEEQHWLSAWYDPVASLSALSGSVRLCDAAGDGEDRLLAADHEMCKLRVYGGQRMDSEHTLLDTPVSLCSFYTDRHEPRVPVVAVASGPHVFIYRNLRPYFKFTVPPLEVDEQEAEVWAALKTRKVEWSVAYDKLRVARDNGAVLTARSLDLLALADAEARSQYVEEHAPQQLVQQTCVTVLETLMKDSDDSKGIGMLVVGTESGDVLVLDPPGQQILRKVQLKSVPVFMAVSGCHDVDYRIVVACRDGNVYTIKNGNVTGTAIELESQVCGVVRQGKSVVVATMDRMVHSFHLKGKKVWSIQMPSPITCIAPLVSRRNDSKPGLLVALGNGDVRLYMGKSLISVIRTGDAVTAMRFGRYGREDNTLVLIHKSGALTIKMLKRTAKLDKPDKPPGPPPEQDIPLRIPKKTKLYVDQTQRERDQAVDMHRIFQRDLCKLRLNTARAYVKIITEGNGPLSYSSGTGASLRLNAQVGGLGPFFQLKIELQNTGNTSLCSVPIAFEYNRQLYAVSKPLLMVPLLLPGVLYNFEVQVQCINEGGGADDIRLYVINPDSAVPTISAIVSMPISEEVMG